MSILPVQNHQALARKASEDARQYVYRVLKACILDFILPPKQKLNEVSLAESLEVSRTPVHDTFSKLSREYLVDIFPKRGAFVSVLDQDRIEQAVWAHTHLGTAALNRIYIRQPDQSRLMVLRHMIHQLDNLLARRDLDLASHIIIEYMHQLYLLAGDMDFIWDSLQKVDVDYRRLLHLATGNATVTEGFIYELSALTDALSERNFDKACDIYKSHLSRTLLMIQPIRQIHPDYFT